jgi:hypothetical protein
MARTPAETTHDLTVAQISRLRAEYAAERRAAIAEMVVIEQRRHAGQPEPPPLSDHAKAARERAAEIINGHAPPGFLQKLLGPASREQELRIQIDAYGLVLDALAQKETVQLAVEAVEWEQRHLPEWRSLCHDIIATALLLRSLEQRAAELKHDRGMFGLPLDAFIGGKSVVGVRWETDPLASVTKAAADAGIITREEIDHG